VVEIPESLLRRSAEAKAKALGVPVEQVLAEMKGEGPPVEVAQPDPAAPETDEVPVEPTDSPEDVGEDVGAPEPVEEVPSGDESEDETPQVSSDIDQDVAPEEPKEAPSAIPEESSAAMVAEAGAVAVAQAEAEEADEAEEGSEIPVVDVEEQPAAKVDGNGSGNGAGNGKVATLVSARPTVPPAGLPEGVRTQRLLTVVKSRAIQNVKAEPTDKVNTWPHLMLMEFGALLAITGLLVIMSVVIHSPLLEPANFNATPNPSKAPWYFLGLQELLSYFDPQIAGVTVPTIVGLIGFMAIPYVDKNPSTRPTDRKFAILLYSIFLAGAATLTIIGVLFRGQGFNFTYPWIDGVYFDDLKDWVHFE
jgi:menaquinol-cytochrome c reductase cytochrome b/c subunit